MKYDVKDLGLADEGKRKAEWASKEMPVLDQIKKRFEKEKPLEGSKSQVVYMLLQKLLI